MRLERLLRPRSIAIIGASDEPSRIGGRPLAYLKAGRFPGRIFPINPNRSTVQGLPAWPDVAAVGEPIDLAVVAVPAERTAEAVTSCAALGVGAAIIFTAGFAETDADGQALQERLAGIGRAAGMRILGPNCLGLFCPGLGLYPTFTATLDRGLPRPGNLSIVSQSGAFGSHLFFMAAARGLGTRYWIATGNEADVDVAEVLHWLALDPGTAVIMAYTEGVKDGPRFTAALEAARANRKPVAFMKVGRSALGAEAISSHTAALAGEDRVYDAVLKRHGAWRARTADELVDIAYAASRGVYPASNRLGLITISGGVGALMADDAAERGLVIPPMPDAAQAKLKALVPFASPRNPIDLTAQPFNDIDLVRRNLEIMVAEGGYDSIVAFFTSVAGSPAIFEPLRRAVRDVAGLRPGCLFLLSALVDDAQRAAYEADGIPVFEDPSRAVNAVAAMAWFARAFRTPPVPWPESRSDEPITGPLDEHAAKQRLAAWGLPVPSETLARSADEAMAAFRAIGRPVVLKLVAAHIAHKSELGGVLLDLRDEAAVRAGFAALMARTADVEAVLVAPYLTGGVELILGMRRDPVFGPILLLGLGGVLAEALRDTAIRPLPVDAADVLAMVGELEGAALLHGFRGRPPGDLDALADAALQLAAFAIAHAHDVASVEINPLLLLPRGEGVVVLDALIVPGRIAD